MANNWLHGAVMLCVSMFRPRPCNNEPPNPALRRSATFSTDRTPLADHPDAINRYRIIHPEKEMRPLSRRLHRYGATTALGTEPEGMDHERDMIRLEAMKWKMGVERMLGSVRNLERQRTTYQARATETGASFSTLERGQYLDRCADGNSGKDGYPEADVGGGESTA